MSTRYNPSAQEVYKKNAQQDFLFLEKRKRKKKKKREKQHKNLQR